MGQWGATPVDSKAMPFSDKLFYVVSGAFLAIFGTGLWALFIDKDLWIGIPVTILGLIGMAGSLYERERFKAITSLAGVAIFVGLVSILAAGICVIDIVDRHRSRTSALMTSVDMRDPSSKEAEVIRDLAIKGEFRVSVWCLMTETGSCPNAKKWREVLKTAGWKPSELNETDLDEPSRGLIVCHAPDDPIQRGMGEFELALRENAIPVSDDCRTPDIAKDPKFEFALLVGSE